jgi:hypothetical protein
MDEIIMHPEYHSARNCLRDIRKLIPAELTTEHVVAINRLWNKALKSDPTGAACVEFVGTIFAKLGGLHG